MGVIINQPVQRLAFVQAAAGISIPKPALLFLFLPGNNDNDVRLRGLILIFVAGFPPPLNNTWAFFQARPNYERNGYIIPFGLQATDIIRFVPFFDYTTCVIAVEPSPPGFS